MVRKLDRRICCYTFFIFGLIFCLFYYYSLKGAGGIVPEFYDFDEHWKASAYLFNGVDPFLAVNSAVDLSIGKMMSNFISVPWSYLLTTIYAPGFLPLEVARIYGMIFFVALVIIDIFFLSKIIKIVFNINYAFRLSACVILAYPNIYTCWIQGNNAILVSSCIIISLYLLLIDKQISAGVFLGIAMVKPQLAFLFFIPLLFSKKYRAVATSITVVMGAWIITSIILKENMIDMFISAFSRGMDQQGDDRYAGLFSILRLINISRSLSMKIKIGRAHV